MTITPDEISRALQSRWLMMLMAVAMVAGTWSVFDQAGPVAMPGDGGLLFPSPNLWPVTPVAGAVIGIVITLVTTALILALNTTYNLLRSVTRLDGTLFMVMMMAVPLLTTRVYGGSLLALSLVACVYMVYDAYGDVRATLRVFTVFLVLSVGAMLCYTYVIYIPVFVLALGQMRIFGVRTLVAALLGLITPWWIVLGLDIASVADIHLPDMTSPDIAGGETATVMMMVTAVVTAIVLVVAWFANLGKMLSYNTRLRACWGTLSLLGLVTIVAMFIDYGEVARYLPMLFVVTAMQVNHTVANRRAEHTAVAVTCILALYIILYICQVCL